MTLSVSLHSSIQKLWQTGLVKTGQIRCEWDSISDKLCDLIMFLQSLAKIVRLPPSAVLQTLGCDEMGSQTSRTHGIGSQMCACCNRTSLLSMWYVCFSSDEASLHNLTPGQEQFGDSGAYAEAGYFCIHPKSFPYGYTVYGYKITDQSPRGGWGYKKYQP